MRLVPRTTVAGFAALLREATAPGGPGITGRVLAHESLTPFPGRRAAGLATWTLHVDALRCDGVKIYARVKIGLRWLNAAQRRRDPFLASNAAASRRALAELDAACWRYGVELTASLGVSCPGSGLAVPASQVELADPGPLGEPVDVLAVIGGGA